MKKAIKDTDYLYASARLRSLERGLLSRERMERMCDAKSIEDAAKVLSECNYGDFSPSSLADVESVLARERNASFELVGSMAPDKKLVDVFRVKYDYHNLKTILKGEQAGEAYSFLLIPCGTVPVSLLTEMMREVSYGGMSKVMHRAVEEAKDVLGRTSDPQLSDFILDRACYEEMLSLATATGSQFLSGYVKLLVDAVNLRSAIRIKRMGKSFDFLRSCLIPGGNVDIARLSVDLTPDLVESIYHSGPLAVAAVAGAAALRGEASLANVDLKCDDAVTAYLKGAKYVAFGEQSLVAYLAAKESEFTAVRTIMAGRFAGLAPEMIRERLREAYV